MTTPDIDAIVDDVKESFDLDEFLNGIPSRFKTQKLYTDRDLGEKLGGWDVETNQFGTERKRRWGVIGQIDELTEELEVLKSIDNPVEGTVDRINEITDEIGTLALEASALLDELDKSALEVEIQSLPPIITKDARRIARANLEIKEKVGQNHPRFDEYLDEYNAVILSKSVVSITKLATGAKNNGLSLAGAKGLYEKLPQSEVDRLDAVVNEVVFKSSIAQHIALDADF